MPGDRQVNPIIAQREQLLRLMATEMVEMFEHIKENGLKMDPAIVARHQARAEQAKKEMAKLAKTPKPPGAPQEAAEQSPQAGRPQPVDRAVDPVTGAAAG